MAEIKTKRNDRDVNKFLESVENKERSADAAQVIEIMREVTGSEPEMWGTSIIGFGKSHYTYANGKKADWFLTGLSPRKQALTLYIMDGFKGHKDLMDQLGKHKTGKSCLYVKHLSDIDEEVLRQLITESVEWVKEYSKRHACSEL